MAGLRIKLNAGECILINGVVVRNGPKQCSVTIETRESNILRLKEAIDSAHANTPVRRLWLLAQSIVAGLVDFEKAQQNFIVGLSAVCRATSDTEPSALCNIALDAAERGDFYAALRAIRQLSNMIDPPYVFTLKDNEELRVEDLISTEC